MKKLILSSSSILLCSLAVFSQKTTPEIISAGGGDSQVADGIQLEWTIGESAVGVTGTSNRIYTIGFHQPMLVTMGTSKKNDNGSSIKIYPNPAQNYIRVIIPPSVKGGVKLVMADYSGKILIERTLAVNEDSPEIQVRQLAAGSYQLRILDSSGNLLQFFKIVKTN